MKLAIVSFKECWQDENGRWFSYGGFPLQMEAISSLFEDVTIVIVQVPQRAGGIPLPEKAQVVPLRRPSGTDTRRKLSVLSQFPYYMRSILKQTRPADVVHVPVPGDIPLLGMAAGLVQGKRLIVRYCGSWEDNAQTTWVNRLTKKAMQTLAGGKNVMLATGIGNSQPPAPRMSWVPVTALRQEELDRIHPVYDRGVQNPPRIGFVGRLAPEKGVDYLIRAVACLRDEHFHPLPRVTLMGDGPQHAELEALAVEKNVADLFTFTGQLDRDALVANLSQQDFTVQPTLSEGLSKAWLDAMAHGLPVVASEVGAARDVIGLNEERGWLIQPRDEDALVAIMKRVICDPRDWPALRRRCRAYAEGQTIEGWAELIGSISARQWGVPFAKGKLIS